MASVLSDVQLPDSVEVDITANIDGSGSSIATVRINNPAKRNSVDIHAVTALADVIDTASADPLIRALIITGDDSAFCAGADLEAVSSPEQQPDDQGMFPVMAEVERLILAIVRGGLPVISAVEGGAAGVGASIALACDIIVASESSFFLLPFANIALIPDGGVTATLVSSLGRVRTMDLALRASRLPASEAKAAGAITEVVAAGTAYARAVEVATTLAASDATAYAATKSAINALALPGMEQALADESRTQSHLLRSPNFTEGVSAFLERRPPTFQ